ncbi:serine/threonine protein kinase [archaeon]|nr:MAG: serine/threonine protein kinase [archaeon]RLG66023.1 MAG: serine/threonine protein kinase [archaeon]HDM23775.1 serine/threonine protein kinase [Candidatus Bathyarchaeota archaeon]
MLHAARVYRQLIDRDFKVLKFLEDQAPRYYYVPMEIIVKSLGMTESKCEYTLRKLHKLKLIRARRKPYLGFYINMHGYDALAINALVNRGVIEAIGDKIGVGKESDVYTALTSSGERVAIKFFRIGRLSFKHIQVRRAYYLEAEPRKQLTWIKRSMISARREYRALKRLHPEVSVPRPVAHNRHVVVMGEIYGIPLSDVKDLDDPSYVLELIINNLKKAYEKNIIHADFSHYNVMVTEEGVLLIDWPQYVHRKHPLANEYLRRDVENIVRFFSRKFRINVSSEEVIAYILGSAPQE